MLLKIVIKILNFQLEQLPKKKYRHHLPKCVSRKMLPKPEQVQPSTMCVFHQDFVETKLQEFCTQKKEKLKRNKRKHLKSWNGRIIVTAGRLPSFDKIIKHPASLVCCSFECPKVKRLFAYINEQKHNNLYIYFIYIFLTYFTYSLTVTFCIYT